MRVNSLINHPLTNLTKWWTSLGNVWLSSKERIFTRIRAKLKKSNFIRLEMKKFNKSKFCSKTAPTTKLQYRWLCSRRCNQWTFSYGFLADAENVKHIIRGHAKQNNALGISLTINLTKLPCCDCYPLRNVIFCCGMQFYWKLRHNWADNNGRKLARAHCARF